MQSHDLYQQKLLSIPDAVALVQSHQTIGVAMAAAEPPGLLGELGNHRDRLAGVSVWVCLPLRQYALSLGVVGPGAVSKSPERLRFQ